MKKITLSFLLVMLLSAGCQTVRPDNVVLDCPVAISGYTDTNDLSDFIEFVDQKTFAIINKYNPSFHKQVKVILYPSVEALHEAQRRKNAPDWSVGSARSNGDIWMVNPYCSSVHDYDEMKKILIHEYTHVVISSINKSIPIWLNEGIACYEADQNKDAETVDYIKRQAEAGLIPNYWEIDKDHSTGNVYIYARSIVEYIKDQYSLESLKRFILCTDTKKVFGISRKEFQEGWKKYIIEKY